MALHSETLRLLHYLCAVSISVAVAMAMAWTAAMAVIVIVPLASSVAVDAKEFDYEEEAAEGKGSDGLQVLWRRPCQRLLQPGLSQRLRKSFAASMESVTSDSPKPSPAAWLGLCRFETVADLSQYLWKAFAAFIVVIVVSILFVTAFAAILLSRLVFLAQVPFCLLENLRFDSARPSPESWRGVRRLAADSSEAAQVIASVRDHCKTYSSKYSFALEVEEVYSASRLPKLHAMESQVLQLYHGTSFRNARSINADGFRLPSHPGMFGRGIYFADTPLKAWQYSKGSRYLLIVEVVVGNALKLHKAKDIDPEKDFRHGWFMRLRGARDYDSVIGMTYEQGGSLRVPEYVVYDPKRTAVRYIVKCKEILKVSY